jgi:DNA-binding CsgD family transcriptional regulator
MSSNDRSPLTPREAECLSLAGSGLTDVEIGGRLGISRRTVGKHLQNIYAKLDVRDRRSAASHRLLRQGGTVFSGPAAAEACPWNSSSTP